MLHGAADGHWQPLRMQGNMLQADATYQTPGLQRTIRLPHDFPRAGLGKFYGP
jgi:hypothetical protein